MPFKHMDEIAVYWIGNACEWRPETVQRAYELVVRSWTDAGHEPNQIAAQAPGVGKNYGSFRQKRRFVEKAGFENIQSLSIARLPVGCRHVGAESDMNTMIDVSNSLLTVGCVPSLLGAAAYMVRDTAQELIELSGCRYAYMVRLPQLYGPSAYGYCHSGVVDNDWRPDELRLNHQQWDPRTKWLNPLLAAGILRNIYPENYLSAPHLNARLGKTSTTLKQWIEADPAGRGTLEPFTDILAKWMPPIEKIAQIREELYRAGRVFHAWFMFPGSRNAQGGMTPEPLYRPDLSAPWEAPDPIPEIYRADFWKDKDPSLTY
jgi:hypothetical protein